MADIKFTVTIAITGCSMLVMKALDCDARGIYGQDAIFFLDTKQKIGEDPISKQVESCDCWCIFIIISTGVEAECHVVTFTVEAEIHVVCTGILH